MAGVPFERVMQLRVQRTKNRVVSGSGVLVTPELMLTAAHVVFDKETRAPAPVVHVRALQGERWVDGVVVWPAARGPVDAALVRITDPEWQAPLGPWEVRWGQLTGQAGRIGCEAMGFPRVLKESQDRQSLHLDGHINPGTRMVRKPGNATGRRYDINVDSAPPKAPPPPDPDDPDAVAPSPWGGMSGAGLFAAGQLIGIVIIDTPGFDEGVLTAVPVTDLHADDEFRALVCGESPLELESVELDGLFRRPNPSPSSPASLLRADSAVVRFRGRCTELETLRAWCTTDDPAAVGLVTGPGGQGKTRLAGELCTQLRSSPHGWLAGFVPADTPDSAIAALSDTRLPVLLVIDYAEARADQVRRLVKAVHDAHRPIRMLLLARAAGEWWTGGLLPDLDALPDPLETSLSTLEDTHDGFRQAYQDALTDLAPALSRLQSHGQAGIDWAGTDWEALAGSQLLPDLTEPADTTALSIQLRALTDLLTAATHTGTEDTPGQPGRSPEEVLLNHERRYWRVTAEEHGLKVLGFQPDLWRRAVAAATLCGAADSAEAAATIARIPRLENRDEEERVGLARWVADLYPAPQGRYWGALEPDRIGEYFIAAQIREHTDLAPALLAHAADHQTHQALTVLTRAAHAHADLGTTLTELIGQHLDHLARPALQVATQTEHPQPLVRALGLASAHATAHELETLTDALPEASTRLASLAADLTRRVVAELRQENTQDNSNREALVDALDTYARRLAAVGKDEDALAAIGEAASIEKELTRGLLAEVSLSKGPLTTTAQPGEKSRGYSWLGDQSLRSLMLTVFEAKRRVALGDGAGVLLLPEVVAALRERNELHSNTLARTLAYALNAEAAAFIEDANASLAPAVAEWAYVHALSAASEAAEIERTLAAESPDTGGQGLARSLKLQAEAQARLGHPKESLLAITDAVRRYRDVAAIHPDAYRHGLADLLTNRAAALAGLDRYEEAVADATEAVHILQDLVGINPGAILPSLATAQRNQAAALNDLGSHSEALRAATDAVATCQELVAKRPKVYWRDLALLLGFQSTLFEEQGRHVEALEAKSKRERLILLHM